MKRNWWLWHGKTNPDLGINSQPRYNQRLSNSRYWFSGYWVDPRPCNYGKRIDRLFCFTLWNVLCPFTPLWSSRFPPSANVLFLSFVISLISLVFIISLVFQLLPYP